MKQTRGNGKTLQPIRQKNLAVDSELKVYLIENTKSPAFGEKITIGTNLALQVRADVWCASTSQNKSPKR